MDGRIKAEWDPLEKVVIHRPGFEVFLGLLEPFGSLFERAFSQSGAVREHKALEQVLQHEFGVEVLRLEDEVISAAKSRPSVREALVAAARDAITYEGEPADVERARAEFEDHAQNLDAAHFWNVFMMRPVIDLHSEPGTRNISLTVSTSEPVSNLYFMRDQQMTTDKGIVITRMAKPARRWEPQVTKFLWEHVYGMPIALEIEAPGVIEGGEFLPMGRIALIGIGDRTNRCAIDQLLAHGVDFEEVGVVHQPHHPLIPAHMPDPMVDMHLDTYFNVASRDVVIGSTLHMHNAKVEVWHNDGNGYSCEPETTTLYDYMRRSGFEIIELSVLEQLSYASNFLCIRDRQILSIEVERNFEAVLANLAQRAGRDSRRYGKLYAHALDDFDRHRRDGHAFPHRRELYEYGIDAYPIIVKNLTGGYGGAHCMTCALSRG